MDIYKVAALVSQLHLVSANRSMTSMATDRVRHRLNSYLSRTNLNIKVIPLVGNLEDLGPCEAVNTKAIPVDEKPRGTNTDHDVNILAVLGLMEVHSVHSQFLGILQVVELRFCWCLSSEDKEKRYRLVY